MRSILITGVGGGVGQSIIKSLQDSGHRLVGADGDALGAGLYAVDKAYRIPFANDSEFIGALLDIATAEKCGLLFPGLDAELPFLAAEAERFKAAGIEVVVSNPEVVRVCDDKLATAQFLATHGFPCPRTDILVGSYEAGDARFPLVLKPRFGGARSKGVFVVRTADELVARRERLSSGSHVVQEYVEGDEYTCGSVSLEGRCLGAITMRRVLRDGDTYKAFVKKDPELSRFVVSVVEALRPFGACNVQLRLRDGVPYVFEFNARCSGTTYCRTLAGFNEPRMIADYLFDAIEPRFEIEEKTILRYWKELVVDNARIDDMTTTHQLVGNGSRL